MRSLVLISVALLQISWCYAYPKPAGVGAYAYQDSAGHSKPARLQKRSITRPFRPFRPLRPLRPMRFPNFGGFPFFGPGPMSFSGGDGAHNAAFAGAAAGPGYRHQVAAIDPVNVDVPNVDVANRFNDVEGRGPGKFYSVSSSSFASSSNKDGKVQGHREAETIVNENGKITKYKVHS